jgi:Putative translation initiation inhibitor, yjgF family
MAEIVRLGTTERLSKAVIYGNLVFLSGVVPGPDPAEVNITYQAKVMLERVEKNLAEAGTSKDKLLSATIYLRDMNDFHEFNQVWNAWLVPGQSPARTAVQANLARQNELCEVTVIAAKD